MVRRIIDTTRRRRRARLGGQPGGAGPARQPRPVRQGGRGVPGRRRRRHAVRAAGLPHGRGRPGQRPRRRHPDRGRLGQAADRPPGQGPGVGRGVPGRRVRDAVPVQPVAHAVDLVAGRAAGAAARRRPRPAAARGATTRPRSTPTAPDTRAHDAGGGAPARLRRLHPRRAPPQRVRRTSGARGRRRSARRPTRASVRDQLDAWGEPLPSGTGWTSRPRATPTRTPPSTRPGRGPSPARAARRALRLEAAARGASRPTRRPTTTTSTWSRRPGSPSGTPSSTGSLAEARRDRAPDRRRAAARQPVGDRAARGCATDPEAFARDLARPMPRQPSPAARFGTRFHAWVEARFGQQDLFDPDDLPGRADAGIDDDDDLAELIATFERGPFADRAPHAVEAPFALVLAGQVVRGRIDAVYAEPRRRLPGRRLEDQPHGDRRPAPAGALPARLGRAAPASRSSRCGRRSTTCAAGGPSSPTTCRRVTRSRPCSRPL